MNTKMTDLSGVIVATALPYREDLSAPAGLAVDYERYAEHCCWLVDNGARGVGPNGSLGEYSSLTNGERRRVAQAAVAAVGKRAVVVAGVHGAGSHQARQQAELAAEDGADGVLCLPPIQYHADRREIIAHFGAVASVGLPVIVYNNPLDTKVDLTPPLLAELAQIDGIVAVKEFSGDVRRAWMIRELAPNLQVIAGADDVALELLLAGATGWFAGYPNVFPAECVSLYDLARVDEFVQAREMYSHMVAAFRWDSRTEFVQAIKLGMDQVGRFGGPCRPPRMPLTDENYTRVVADTKQVIDYLTTH